ncbi:MAG: SPOR domain-containing protein [Chlorobiaceae bacterium]|nr:SPOR domain-containing protein [Chlorobiaceae bacterium]
MQKARNLLLPAILISGSLSCPAGSYGAEAARSSFASEIVKDVREDKVYLLENIRHKLTKPSEKAVVDALLTEDGPKAAGLYRKQLSEYPDPQLDEISRSRLAAYDRTMAATAKPVMNTPKPGSAPPPATAAARKADSVARQPKAPMAKPAANAATQPATAKAPAPTTPKPLAGSAFTLQFGSFDNAANAGQLASQLSSSSPAKVVEVNGIYKVRLRKAFASREEASAFRRSLPYESFVVTDQP